MMVSTDLTAQLGAGSTQSNVSADTGTPAASASAPVDLSGAIDALYVSYLGRHATSTEVLALTTQINSGASTLDSARTTLLTSADARAYVPTAVTTTYQTWAGRAASTDEIAVWTNEMSLHGATLATVRNAILTDPAARSFSVQAITQAYQQWGGRAPTVAELSAWQNMFLGGLGVPTDVKTAIQNDPLGIGYAGGVIDGIYQQWGGRAASASDIGTWMQVLRNGGTFDQVKAGVLAAPLGQDYMAARINQLYLDWGGRAATSDDLGTWKNEIQTKGATFDSVRLGIINDPLGADRIAAQVTQVYQQWGGRAPTAGEIATWHDTVALHGGTMQTVKMDILADPLGVNYAKAQLTTLFASNGWGTVTQADADALLAQLRGGATFADAAATIPHHNTLDPAVLNHIYEGFAAFVGRAPTEAEANGWASSVQPDGTGMAGLRAALLGTAEGQAYLAAQTTAAFQSLAARAPTPTELSDWQTAITSGTATLDDMRRGAIDTADGQAHATASIAALFNAYFGRDATSVEIATELSSFSSGRTIAGIGSGIFASSEGLIHFTDMLNQLYGQLLGRSPTAAENSDWFDALYGGATYDTMRATLALDPASTAAHFVGTVADDVFSLGGAPGDAIITAFDAAHDKVTLPSSYASANLLDAAHASLVSSLDGETPNVVIRLDAQHSLIFHGMTLAQLSSSDFAFG